MVKPGGADPATIEEGDNRVDVRGEQSSRVPDNQIYYFVVGAGEWRGHFSLDVHDWSEFWRDRIGLKNQFLVLGMAAV